MLAPPPDEFLVGQGRSDGVDSPEDLLQEAAPQPSQGEDS